MTIAVDRQVEVFRENFRVVRDEVSRIIVGNEDNIVGIMTCLLARGHVLLEGIPGIGKTKLVQTLADVLHLKFSRIQFTPDLMPGDIIGTTVVRETDTGRKFMEFQPGPVFANLVLADEINRATPKTQSSLLEVMDRGKVTVDGAAHAVGVPFMVVATQNPVDYEGTFPLPESQMDRFLMRLQMGYPEAADELEILRTPRLGYDAITLNPVATRTDVIKLQQLTGRVFVEDSVLEYVLKIVGATRLAAEFKAGVSVRGGLSLRLAAQAHALVRGRDFVIPQDVQEVAGPVLAHRLALARQTSDALEERRTVLASLRRIIASVPVPE